MEIAVDYKQQLDQFGLLNQYKYGLYGLANPGGKQAQIISIDKKFFSI